MPFDPAEQTRKHYERYPYPGATIIDWSPHTLDLLNFVTGRCNDRPIPDDCRILVAGCGTKEAAVWSLALPAAQIVGIDFSHTSLRQAARLVADLGLSHVELRQADLLGPAAGLPEGPFDLIVAYGVIHHLAHPALGLANLRARLASDGILQLMVYSSTHRAPVRQLDRIGARLAGASADAEARVKWLLSLAEQTAEFPGPLQLSLTALRDQAGSDQAAMMDTFGHPHYRMYTVAALWRLLQRAGLRFVSWTRPGDWDVRTYLDPGPLAQRMMELPQMERFDLLDRLFAPLFVLHAERNDRTPRDRPLPYEADDDEWLRLVLAPARRQRIEFDSHGQTESTVTYAPTVSLTRRATVVEFLPGLRYEDDPAVGALLGHFDGRRTLAEVIAATSVHCGLPVDALRPLALQASRSLLSPHEALVPLPARGANRQR